MRKQKVSFAEQLTRLAGDRAPKDRAALLAEIMAYAETDLLYYRAAHNAPCLTFPLEGEGSEQKRVGEGGNLRMRQDAIFDPILSAITKAYGLCFTVTEGVMPVTQPEASLLRLRMLFEETNDRELAALFVMTPLLGSALLSLAVWKGLTTVDQAIAAATLDESFQAEQWMEDAEEKARRDARGADIRQCALFINN